MSISADRYEEIKAAAEAAGETVNSYIKKSIDMRMEAEGISIEAE